MNTVQRIAKNTGVLLISQIASYILGFFFVMYTACYLGAEGDQPPGSKLNPTKATPSHIEVLDSGSASILIEGKTLKIVLKGKKLKGVWIASQQENSDMWSISKSESK